MKQYLCRVTENRKLWADVQLLAFDAPELAQAMRPGHFALARIPATIDPYLRRTLWLYDIAKDRVAFTLPSTDPLVAHVSAGRELDVLAPLGRAIEFDDTVKRVLLIGEGAPVVRLVAIAHAALSRGSEVVFAAYHTQGTESFPAHLLSPEIEYRTGSDVLTSAVISWADAIVASGSDGFFRTLADAVRTVRYRLELEFARVLVDRAMPCGTGLCYCCTIDTSRGIQLTCVDGPSFDLIEFENRRRR